MITAEEIRLIIREEIAELAQVAKANPLLTVRQSAKRKGVSVTTFYQWMEKGLIKPIPEMEEARFPQSKVDALFSK